MKEKVEESADAKTNQGAGTEQASNDPYGGNDQI
jgi:hypothetical protein